MAASYEGMAAGVAGTSPTRDSVRVVMAAIQVGDVCIDVCYKLNCKKYELLTHFNIGLNGNLCSENSQKNIKIHL